MKQWLKNHLTKLFKILIWLLCVAWQLIKYRKWVKTIDFNNTILGHFWKSCNLIMLLAAYGSRSVCLGTNGLEQCFSTFWAPSPGRRQVN